MYKNFYCFSEKNQPQTKNKTQTKKLQIKPKKSNQNPGHMNTSKVCLQSVNTMDPRSDGGRGGTYQWKKRTWNSFKCPNF